MKIIITSMQLFAFVILGSFNSTAQSVHYDSLIHVALTKRDTGMAAHHLVAKLKKADPTKAGGLELLGTNNQIFQLFFKYSAKKKQLLTGAVFMEAVVNLAPEQYQGDRYVRANYIDTYANLLYKAGKVKKAIEWQQEALANADEGQKAEFSGNLEKMKMGLPTW